MSLQPVNYKPQNLNTQFHSRSTDSRPLQVSARYADVAALPQVYIIQQNPSSNPIVDFMSSFFSSISSSFFSLMGWPKAQSNQIKAYVIP